MGQGAGVVPVARHRPAPAGHAAAPQWRLPKFSLSPDKLQELQQQYVAEATELWQQGFAARPAGTTSASPARPGRSNPVAAFSAAVYLLNARTLLGMAEAVEADDKTRARLRFAVEQWMAASAPSNFLAFNAEAQKKALETQGESIAKGMQNLLHDMQQGHVSMTDESAFEVGRNVATTEGAVVFENELFQLLEYKPLTRQGLRAAASCWCRPASTSSTSSTCSPRTR